MDSEDLMSQRPRNFMLSGKPTSVTDPLGNTTTYAYVDHLNRLTQMNEPTGAVTTISYAQPILTTVLHTQSASPAASTHSEVVTDGFGRDIEDRQYTDAQHLIAIDHGYDAMGRISFQANPTLITISGWTNDGLAYHTVYGYDSLSRVTQVTLPDGNSTTTSYSGNATTVTDAASHSTQTLMDALGRLSSVHEDAGSSPHLNLQTEYTYDALGDLTLVSKCLASGCGSGQENRFFTYDSLRRLTQATNPESGTYTYSYTNSSKGNQLALQSRMDPRGFTTTYTHDGMDRVTGIGYNDGTPNGSYTYNAIGKLTQASNSNVTNNYTAFDADGRVTASNMQVGSVTYTFAYQYDLGGDLIQETYPSGRVVNTTYDAAMRPLTASGTSGSTVTHYVQGAGYYPHGAPQYWAYGNGLWSWETFTKLLQPYQGWATQGNNGNNWMFYAGNSFNANETVSAQQEGFSPPNTPGVPWNSMTFLNGQFGYDSLNRLNSVADTNYARTYHYDDFGNLSLQTNSGVPLSGVTPVNNGVNPYTAATNHLVSVDAAGGYDPRGNMTKLGAVTMSYDAESNMTSTVDGGTGQNVSWVYDAEGQRAQKLIAGGSWTLYIHDAFGQLAASYNNNGVTPTCKTCYLTYDMVGTPRLITDQNQNVVTRHDFIPFGEEIQNGVAGRNGNFGYTSNVTQAFTGQESDGGTIGLDYFNARHLAAVLGRFAQPDPMNAGADMLNPQSWNAYAYVLGNPLALVDTSGLADCSVGVDFCDTGYGFDGSEVDTSGASININLFPGGSLSGQCSLCGVKGTRGGATDPIFAITHTDVGLGYSPFSAGSSAPSNAENPPPCQAKILNATNNQFGTNYTDANVNSTFNYSTGAGPGQGTLNLNITGSTAGVTPGYYPIHWYSYIIGYGLTLHVVSGPGGNGGLDSQQTLQFGPNQGTFHIDSGYPHNPFGAIFHGILNMTKAGGYPKC